MTKRRQDFSMYSGEQRVLRFSITASDGVGQDMTGNTASWVLLDEERSTTTILNLSGACLVISGSTVDVLLAGSMTASLGGTGLNSAAHYDHELVATASGSAIVLATGTANIHRSYTLSNA